MENKINNSESYLNSVLGKENGFSIPKSYFETIEDLFLFDIYENKIEQKKSFSTPDSYFENLEEIIITKVASEKKTTKIISLKQKIYKSLPIGIAASIMLFVAINYFSNFNSEINFDSLAQSDIETWILENSSDMTSSDISTFISIEDVNGNDFASTNINDEDIEDYIIYNDNTNILSEIN